MIKTKKKWWVTIVFCIAILSFSVPLFSGGYKIIEAIENGKSIDWSMGHLPETEEFYVDPIERLQFLLGVTGIVIAMIFYNGYMNLDKVKRIISIINK